MFSYLIREANILTLVFSKGGKYLDTGYFHLGGRLYYDTQQSQEESILKIVIRSSPKGRLSESETMSGILAPIISFIRFDTEKSHLSQLDELKIRSAKFNLLVDIKIGRAHV